MNRVNSLNTCRFARQPDPAPRQLPHARHLQGSTTDLERLPGNSPKNPEHFNRLTTLSLPRTSCKESFYDNSHSLVSGCTKANGASESSLAVCVCCTSLPFSLNEVQDGVAACSRSGSKVRGCHFHLLSSQRRWPRVRVT